MKFFIKISIFKADFEDLALPFGKNDQYKICSSSNELLESGKKISKFGFSPKQGLPP